MTDYEAGYTQALIDAIQAMETQKMNPFEDASDATEHDAILSGNAALDEAIDVLSHRAVPTDPPRHQPGGPTMSDTTDRDRRRGGSHLHSFRHR